MGKQVMVFEDDAGNVSIRTEDGRELKAEPFDKVPRARIQPGAVVNNKLLGRVLEYAREQQLEAEEDRAQFSRTKRERRLAAERLVAAGTE